MNPSDVLRTFAELSKREREAPTRVVRSAQEFGWVRYKSRRAFEGRDFAVRGLFGNNWGLGGGAGKRLERILAAGTLHSNEQLLRAGWVWLAGTVEVEGKPVRYCLPIMSVPITRAEESNAAFTSAVLTAGSLAGISSSRGVDYVATPSGDPEISPHIQDPEVRESLLDTVDFAETILKDNFTDLESDYLGPPRNALDHLPDVKAWCEKAAAAMSLTIDEWHLATEGDPYKRSAEPGIAAFVGVGVYLDQAPYIGTRRGSLLGLALLPDLKDSAFSKIYGTSDLLEASAPEIAGIRPLSQRQAQVARRASAAEVALISGAPGTGKTHVLSVIASNAVARGESVLVVGASPFAVDVLIEHFAATPGPTPVAFGGSRYGQRLAQELSELISQHDRAQPETGASAEFDKRMASIERSLKLETQALTLQRDPTRRLESADALDRAGDLQQLELLVNRYDKTGFWPFGKRKRRNAIKARLGITSSEEYLDSTDALSLLDELKITRDAQRLLASDGLTLVPSLEDLVALQDAAARIRGKEITRVWLASLGSAERRTLAEVANAIGSNRSARHRALAEIKPKKLVKAAPLWVGAVRDVDDVLPFVAGMFDLVILDEASQIDQMNAASALVRGKRAIVCGDPNQLGHVSFVSDENLQDAAELFGTDVTRVNTRTHSAFDTAAAAVPARMLDEHFRSAPHLIEFSARRFYGGTLMAATRHPSNEAADHIHLELVEGTREGSSKKVNDAEVARCMEVAERYIAQGVTSVGLVSPFRAQADALEEAILDRYRLEEIERYGLRVGTVHGFQGDERQVMIASWAVGADEEDSAWRFVNQRNLFNVMITRAREEMVIVTSNPEPPGLAGEYVQWSEPLTNLVADVKLKDPWVNRVAGALGDAGVPVRTGYRVGHHVIDIVVGKGSQAIAVDCGPHPDGVDAHMDRALMLRRAGWRTADAYATKWSDDVGQLAVELGAY